MSDFRRAQLALDSSLPGYVNEPLLTVEDRAKERWHGWNDSQQCAFITERLDDLLHLNQTHRHLSAVIRDQPIDDKLIRQACLDKIYDFLADEIREEDKQAAEQAKDDEDERGDAEYQYWKEKMQDQS